MSCGVRVHSAVKSQGIFYGTFFERGEVAPHFATGLARNSWASACLTLLMNSANEINSDGAIFGPRQDGSR